METATLEKLNSMSAEALAARLSAPPEGRAAFVREAAEAGVTEAQALLGQMLLDGHGVARDERRAFAWFNRAAAGQHLMALNMVGRCYDLGWGVAVDKARAAECFRIAARRGLAEAMYNFATALTLGEGVAEDRVTALDWFHRAADLGFAKAANYIGSFHEDGWVVERDLDAAEAQYRIAAEGGDFRGCFNLARLLAARGQDEALVWLARVRESATPPFMTKAEAFLRNAGDPLLRVHGVAVLLGYAEALPLDAGQSPMKFCCSPAKAGVQFHTAENVVPPPVSPPDWTPAFAGEQCDHPLSEGAGQ